MFCCFNKISEAGDSFKSCCRTCLWRCRSSRTEHCFCLASNEVHVMEVKLTCVGDKSHDHREVRDAGVLKPVSQSVIQS